MPTYEYICGACSSEFERFQSITASPLRKCPECGRLKMKRKISAGAGIIFRGSGFYETDYRSESYKSGQRKDTATADTTPAASEAKKKTSADKPKPSTKASATSAKEASAKEASITEASAVNGKKPRKAS